MHALPVIEPDYVSSCVSRESCYTDGKCCIIHECVPPCAWTAVTRSCQQRILERDGTACAEDTLQGLLACGGLWVGPVEGCASLGAGEEVLRAAQG